MSSIWAQRLADLAMAEAARRGVRVSVAVVDRGGDPIQLDRMDDASGGGLAVAQAVATTAVLFDGPSDESAQRLGGADALARVVIPPVLGIAGGVPVHDSGRVVAGLGVGGAEPDLCAEIAAVALASV